MPERCTALIAALLLAIPHPAFSQEAPEDAPESAPESRPALEAPPTPAPFEVTPADPSRSPVILQARPYLPPVLQSTAQVEALETVTAWSAIALGASGAVASLVMLNRARNNTQNFDQRQAQARAAGTTLMGSATTAAAGVSVLQQKKQREMDALKARQDKLFGPPAPSINPALVALEADAERAKKRRNNWATVTALGGILAGGLVSTIPAAIAPQPNGNRRPVDIVPYVSGGAVLMAAGLGAAWYLWRTDPDEVKVFEEAAGDSE